ncbi:MAG: sulfotransferase [Bacteroidia bacterium]|nr:sulfotransferase [Bacteroidia bacterium]
MKTGANSYSPNFFIVGAAKAGTTSLYQYLSQHPDVYMSPIKEPNFFATDIQLEAIRPEVKERLRLLDASSFLRGDMKKTMHRAFITKPDEYAALFRFAAGKKAIGEASASYLFSDKAAANIHQYNPDARIIMILRNPVQRAYSHYLMDRRMAVTGLPFEEALEEERKHPVRSWGSTSLYLELGLYAGQVKRYLDLFPRDQVLILLNEELREHPEDTMKRVYAFLGVDTAFSTNFEKEFNAAAVPRNTLVKKIISVNLLRVKVRRALKNSFLKRFIRKALFAKPAEERPSAAVNARLLEYYKNDIQSLSKLIQKDLSKWLQIS